MLEVSYPQKECATNVPEALAQPPIDWEAIVEKVSNNNSLMVLMARLELARTYSVPRILSSEPCYLSTALNVDNFFSQNLQTSTVTRFHGLFGIMSFENLRCLRSKQKRQLRAVSVPLMCQNPGGESV
jgi:hypothetical protein